MDDNKRIEKLRRKLELVVSRIAAGVCPVHVSEIWVFGSSLRLKEDPHDIDLVLFYRKDDELDKKVELFRVFLQKLRETEEGRKSIQDLVEKPEFAQTAGREVFHLPIEKWTAYLRQTGTWAWMGYSFHPNEITKRVLREGMHGVQISELNSPDDKETWLKSMTARTFRLVWSEEKPDLGANLREIMSPQSRVVSTLSELPNFLEQAERHGAYYDVLKGVTAWVAAWVSEKGELPDNSLVTQRMDLLLSDRGVLKEYWGWIKGEAGSHGSEPSIHTRTTNKDLDVEFSKISGKDLKTVGLMTEQLRDQISRFRAKGRVANILFREIFKPMQGYTVSPISERIETAADRALSWVPMYEATDEVKREVLKEVGLEHVSRRIFLLESPYYRAEYQLARSDDDLRRLIKRQAEGKFAKTHVAYIRRIVRKAFPTPTDISISIKASAVSGDTLIPSTVEISISADKNSTEVIGKAKLLGFGEWENSRWDERIYSSLALDVSPFKGEVAKIKSFVRERLSHSP